MTIRRMIKEIIIPLEWLSDDAEEDKNISLL